MRACNLKFEAISLEFSRIDKQKTRSQFDLQNHGGLSPKLEGIVIMIVIVSLLKRWSSFLQISWGVCRGRLKALRVQRVRTAKRSIPICKFHIVFELYIGIAC